MFKLESFLFVVLASVLAVGCSHSPVERARVDYKRPDDQTLRVDALKVPPELTRPKAENRYSIPGKDGSSLSEYRTDINSQAARAQQPLLPIVPNVVVRRDGIFRWLEVDQPAEDIWDSVKQFWLEEGFIIASEDRESGILETDWAENRARLGGGIINDTLSKIAPLLVTLPERDKFRTRLERTASDKTEIFLSHEGLALVASPADDIDPRRVKARWQHRASDPNLVSEMLIRMSGMFGVPAESPELQDLVNDRKDQIAVTRSAGEIKQNENDYFLLLPIPFDRSWRRVGLILDSLDFSIEDRSREDGIFYIKYNDPDSRVKLKGLARLAFWKDRGNIVQSYRIVLTSSENKDRSEVRLFNSNGEQLSDATALKILRVIQEQLT